MQVREHRRDLGGEERVGLAIALAAHIALLAWIVWRPPLRAPAPMPERIAVTISDDVGLTSTSPEPQAAPAPDVAPQLGEEVADVPRPVTPPKPAPVAVIRPKPQPDIIAEIARRKPARREIPRTSGASRIGNDFIKGIPGAQAEGASRNPPAAAIGPGVQASLASAISRKLRPHWTVPQGADADKLVTVLAWSLNSDGSLAGRPRVVRQEGITDANRPQAALHAEQAIRAVQLAAPFELPGEYYSAWKRVSAFRFDRRLSQ